MKKYRFWTKEECFEYEKTHNSSWNGDGKMDFLYGKEVSKKFYEKVQENPIHINKSHFGEDIIHELSPGECPNWYIREHMLVEEKSNKNQIITRKDLKQIHTVACVAWKEKINEYVSKADPYSIYVSLTDKEVKEMFDASNPSQREILAKYLTEPKTFTVADLKIGEYGYIEYKGIQHLILKHYEGFTSLSDPNSTWDEDACSFYPCTKVEVEIKVK